MKKVIIALATASALTAAGAVSANCSFNQAEAHGDKGTAKVTQAQQQGRFIRVGGYQKKASQPDIVDTAVAAGSFNTLVKAVQAAGLVDTLKGDGPYTVFAPTD